MQQHTFVDRIGNWEYIKAAGMGLVSFFQRYMESLECHYGVQRFWFGVYVIKSMCYDWELFFFLFFISHFTFHSFLPFLLLAFASLFFSFAFWVFDLHCPLS